MLHQPADRFKSDAASMTIHYDEVMINLMLKELHPFTLQTILYNQSAPIYADINAITR